VFDDAQFVTYNGQPIADLDSWTLDQHYQYFGIDQ